MWAATAAIAALAALAGLARAATLSNGCLSSWDSSTDYFDNPNVLSGYPEGTQVTAAQRFSVSYHKYYKVVTVFDPNTKLYGSNYEQYILWLCGSQAPSASDLASAKQEGLNLIKQQIPSYSGDITQKTFQVPIQSVAAAETVSISFLVDALGKANAVKYFSNYTVSPCFQQALELYSKNGSCTAQGLPPTFNAYPSTTAETKVTAAQTAAVDVVLNWSFDNSNAKQAAFVATDDPGPLNRAEWVKMLSTFFNLETVANSYFNTISTDYNSDKAAAAQATQGATLKRVAWVSQVLGYGTTPAMYVVSMAAYKKAHVEDAAGVFPTTSSFPSGTVSSSGDVQYTYTDAASQKTAAAALLKDLQSWGADVIVDETYAVDPSTYDMAAFQAAYCLSASSGCQVDNAASLQSSLKFLANGTVLRYDKTYAKYSVGLDWFESEIPHPERVMKDLLPYTAPSAAPKGYTSYYLRNVSTGEAFNVISASLCATPLAECQATVAATPTPAARKSAAPAAALSAALAAAVAAAALL